jgi:hypothetical protein
MNKTLLEHVIVVAVDLLSGQQQTSTIFINKTSKFQKSQNIKLVALCLSFPEN